MNDKLSKIRRFKFGQISRRKEPSHSVDQGQLKHVKENLEECKFDSRNLFRVCEIHYENMPLKHYAIFHVCKKDNFQMKKCNVFSYFSQNMRRF